MSDPVAWNPVRYGQFGVARLRPAVELLQRVTHPDPRTIHDLGTGRGEMARAMAQRWPDAAVEGSDLSAEMLGEAAATPSRVRWHETDVSTWTPDHPYDVIYTNAVLHWVEDHASLLPRLVSFLSPSGVLAIQMPVSWVEPSHRLMRETLATGGVDGAPLGPQSLRDRLARRPVQDPAWYYDVLAPLVAHIDIWETRYLQVLEGEDAVFEWVSGTALLPILGRLEGDDLGRFVDRYQGALRAAYPLRADGTTLFPFPRLFIVATR